MQRISYSALSCSDLVHGTYYAGGTVHHHPKLRGKVALLCTSQLRRHAENRVLFAIISDLVHGTYYVGGGVSSP
jgi:hypothetical protein